MTGREYLTESSIQIIKENWLLGAGPAGSKYETYKYLPFMLGSPEEMFLRLNYYAGDIGQAHNFYLFYFSDLGIIGFIISILLPVVYMRLAFFIYKTAKKENRVFEMHLAISLMSIGVFYFIRGIFEPSFIMSYGNITQDLPFWICLMLLSFYYNKAVQSV
jgi:O-antigen ligase